MGAQLCGGDVRMMLRFNLAIHSDEKAILQKLSEKTGLSMAAVVRLLIRNAGENQEFTHLSNFKYSGRTGGHDV